MIGYDPDHQSLEADQAIWPCPLPLVQARPSYGSLYSELREGMDLGDRLGRRRGNRLGRTGHERLGFYTNEALGDGESNQGGSRMEVQLLHEASLVKLHRLDREVQQPGNVLQALAFTD